MKKSHYINWGLRKARKARSLCGITGSFLNLEGWNAVHARGHEMKLKHFCISCKRIAKRMGIDKLNEWGKPK